MFSLLRETTVSWQNYLTLDTEFHHFIYPKIEYSHFSNHPKSEPYICTPLLFPEPERPVNYQEVVNSYTYFQCL